MTTGLRRRIAAWTSWKLAPDTSAGTAPVTRTPPSAAHQLIPAGRPVSWSAPRQAPVRLTTPPDLTQATVSRRRAATMRPGRGGGKPWAPARRQRSHHAIAASAGASSSASGAWRGSQRPIPANARAGCRTRAGCPAAPAR